MGARKELVEGEDWNGPAFVTCQHSATVSRAFETCRRRHVLTFSHHCPRARFGRAARGMIAGPLRRTHPSGRQSPLAMDSATFRALGHRLIDQLAGLLESVPRRPVTHDESPSAVRDALDLKGPLPERGAEPGPLLEATAQLLFDHSLFNGHPRFFG
jgi:hypothetical protein